MKLLFVCLGNICRSPAAEGIMQTLLKREGLADRVACDSAGTSAYHEGEPADARMISYARSRGHELTSLSRPFLAPQDFENFDYILTMDASNHRNVMALDKQNQYGHKVMPMVRFCQIHKVSEVPDPYYDTEDGFRLVLDILEDACTGLLHKIKSEIKNE